MNWCHLCGSADHVSVTEAEFVPLAQKICEISLDDNLQTCMDCNIFLYQIQVFIKKARNVANMMATLKKEMSSTQSKNEINSTVTEKSAEQSCSINNQEQCIKNESIPNIEEIYEEVETIYEEEVMEINDEVKNDDVDPDSISQEPDQDDDEKMFTFKCHVCDAPEFKKMFQLSAHTRSKHNALPQVKCYCNKYLSTMRGLQRHRAKHFPRKTDIKCIECRQIFKTKAGLDKHFAKRHGPNKKFFICSQCGRNFCNAKVLERHEITHELPSELRRNFACSECKKCFISNQARSFHFAKYHEKILSYFCEICFKGFYTKTSLTSHEETHKPSESVVCDLCNGSFKTLKYMKKHRSSHFLPLHGSYFLCDICHKQFRKKSLLRAHMLVHSKTAEHTCNICLRSFKKRAYLNTHMVTHTGEKKFQCMFCNRMFGDAGNCRKHKLRDHPGELAEYEERNGKRGVPNTIFIDIQCE
ncbi:CLUMA_CG003425, isoform A [Clunio marinus]|uniref:CLUMA_CG003425, isoform A n=1 Tax=Clunio marinus TaxID=568069 RepID=A0A1J1HR30_9DIPT|nr:CLUMA_CG003425, isoform A [Clunio marinus]